MIIVTGRDGQLGYDVLKRLSSEGKTSLVGADRNDFDLSDPEAACKYITKLSPSIVVHCGAYTAVDKAEEEKDLCMTVNTKGTEAIAKACRDIGAKMLYISTDYVFGGEGIEPFETSSKVNPLNVYALSKYKGEEAVRNLLKEYFIIRTSWVFGINGRNFVKTMLKASETNEEVRVVGDQIGSPTYTPDLAELICSMIKTEKYGTYHASNEGFCSWAEFTEEIYRAAGRATRVKKITTGEYPSKAARPLNSRLSKKSLDDSGFNRLPSWQNAVARFIKELWK